MKLAIGLSGLVAIAGCATGPKDYSAAIWNDGSAVHLDLLGPWDHDFTGATATANGATMPASVLFAGSQDSVGNPGQHAQVQFTLPSVELGTDPALAIEVSQAGETHTFEVATLEIPRTITIATSLDRPLAGGESVALASNIASDEIDPSSSMVVEVGNSICSFGGNPTNQDGASTFTLAPGFTDWYCGPRPAAGTIIDATLAFVVNVNAEASCDVDCMATPLGGGGVNLAKPVRLQF